MSFRSCLGGAVVSAMVLAGAGAFANEPLVKADGFPGEFSANVSLTNEYFFRGISQSDDQPAIQGGFDYDVGLADGVGVYAGVWGSNVNFTDAVLELDWYGGLKGEVKGFSWSAGFIYYYYPGTDSALNYDFWEAAFSLGYDFGVAAVTAGVNYSPNYFADSGNATYYSLGVDVPVGKYLTLHGTVGKQDIQKNANFGTPDYVDYSVGASVNLVGFDVKLAYTDTDMKKSECDDLCGAVVLSVSRSF